MKDITPKSTKKSSGWSAVRQRINWGPSLLIALIKDLYDASASNKGFINARCHLASIKHLTRDMGWGFHDFIVDVIDQHEVEFGG